MMRFLFDGKYAPLTDRISFIKASIGDATKTYRQWTNNMIDPIPEIETEFSGNFEDLLIASLPIKYPERNVFFETKSGWTGHYNNQDTLTYEAENVARLLDTITINVWVQPAYFGRKVNGWGGGAFSFFKGEDMTRHIMLSDQDRWEFDNYGEPFPFEEVEKYKEKFARNRFTPEMLDRYLREFGIYFFDESFYMPNASRAYIIEQDRLPWNENDKPISLKELRKSYRI